MNSNIIELRDFSLNNEQYETKISVPNSKYEDSCVHVLLKMSKEALIGFGKTMIRIALDNGIRNGIKNGAEFHTDPIGTGYASQPLGFFITHNSPDFILLIDDSCDENMKNGKYKNICSEMEKPFKYRLPDEEEDGWIIEEHEIGRYNMGEVIVLDSNGNNISDKTISVVMKIGKKGSFEFGKRLLVMAHYFKIDNIYDIPVEPIENENDYDDIY